MEESLSEWRAGCSHGGQVRLRQQRKGRQKEDRGINTRQANQDVNYLPRLQDWKNINIFYSRPSLSPLLSFIYLVKCGWCPISLIPCFTDEAPAGLPLNRQALMKHTNYPNVVPPLFSSNATSSSLPLETANLPPRNPSCPVFIFYGPFFSFLLGAAKPEPSKKYKNSHAEPHIPRCDSKMKNEKNAEAACCSAFATWDRGGGVLLTFAV